MSSLRHLYPFLLLGAALALPSPASAAPKPAFHVLLEVSVDDKGAAENARIVTSEDTSGEHILDQIAVEKVRAQKFDVHMKDGKAVAYKVRVPFVFPIEGDEGAESNLAPRPSLHGTSQVQPIYPADLAAKGEPGSAIVEVTVGAEGDVKYATILRATENAFGDAALTAVKQWHFTAAQKDGRAISSRWRLAIVFQTDESQPIWEWRIAPRPSLGTYTVMHVLHPSVPKTAQPAPGTATPSVQPAPGAPPAPGK